MGIHYTCRDLDQLSDMSYKQQSVHLQPHAVINRIPDIITALHRKLLVVPKCLPEKIISIISRCQITIPVTFITKHLHFHENSLRQCLFAHRFYDPGGSKYRNPAFNPKSWIKRFLRDLHALRNIDHNVCTAIPFIFLNLALHRFPDHLPWHFVDCCLSGFLLQHLPGKAPDSDSTI